MPDEFWFEVVTGTDVYASDGTTLIGRLQPKMPYRAMDANEHWLAIPGPNGTRGFIAIADLEYVEIDPPGAAGSVDEEPETDEVAPEEPVVAAVTSSDAANGPTSPPEPASPSDVTHVPDETTGSLGEDNPDLVPESGSHDTLAYVHATSEDTDDGEDDPSAKQRRLRMIGAGAIGFIVVLVILITTIGGDSPPPTTLAAPTTTAATSTTTTTAPPPAVSTTVPAVGSTPASATAPEDWRIVFYNDFETSRDRAFPVGEVTASANASISDGAYSIEVTRQPNMETLLQIPLTSRFAYMGATIRETRLEPGAHVCGLQFSTNEGLYIVTINAEVASGPREYAIVNQSGREVLPVTGSTVVEKGLNHVAILVRAPKIWLYINGVEVAKAEVDGNQFTGFGLTYGASSSGECAFDDLEVWRPEAKPADDVESPDPVEG